MSLLSLSHLETASRPAVVARRWDGLGGRLNAIINAMALASALDAEFRFAWPGGPSSPGAAEELFSSDFLAVHAIAIDELDSREVLPDPTEQSLAEARRHLSRASRNTMIDVVEYASTLGFRDESHLTTGRRFRAASERIGWSPDVARVIAMINAGFSIGPYAAIHVRAGDIVEGDWRQFLPVEKYTPRAFVEFAIQRLLAEGAGHVLILSDNEDYARELRQRFDRVRRPQELLPNYVELTTAQRALADIWLLARATRILGPTTSAFSRLAGNLSGVVMRGTHETLSSEEARVTLSRAIESGIAERPSERHRRALLARDIAWYIGVFGDSVPLGERLRLSEKAVACEPDFSGALNSLAFARAFAGDAMGARTASLRAFAAAGASRIHADPTVDSLATAISSEALEFGRTARGDSAWGLMRRDRRSQSARQAKALDGLSAQLVRCEAMVPYQIHHQDVLFNLRFQLAALHWLGQLDDKPAAAARSALAAQAEDPPLPGVWRLPGLSTLSAPGGFPLTLRRVEIVSIRLARAIGEAVQALGWQADRPSYCYVESVTTSLTGLRWVNGWAHDPKNRAGIAFGLSVDVSVASGGLTFIPRPDVVATLKDEKALTCGFSFPVPANAPDEFGELQSAMTTAPRRKRRFWF